MLFRSNGCDLFRFGYANQTVYNLFRYNYEDLMDVVCLGATMKI